MKHNEYIKVMLVIFILYSAVFAVGLYADTSLLKPHIGDACTGYVCYGVCVPQVVHVHFDVML